MGWMCCMLCMLWEPLVTVLCVAQHGAAAMVAEFNSSPSCWVLHCKEWTGVDGWGVLEPNRMAMRHGGRHAPCPMRRPLTGSREKELLRCCGHVLCCAVLHL
eukprot:jgi/Ulvmu1/881/UM100_0034.1